MRTMVLETDMADADRDRSETSLDEESAQEPSWRELSALAVTSGVTLGLALLAFVVHTLKGP